MQKVERVKDKMRPTRSVGRSLRLGETRQAVFVQAAQFPVDVGGLRPHGRECRQYDGIFGAPIEARASSSTRLGPRRT
jgi:hypothetical protein